MDAVNLCAGRVSGPTAPMLTLLEELLTAMPAGLAQLLFSKEQIINEQDHTFTPTDMF